MWFTFGKTQFLHDKYLFPVTDENLEIMFNGN